MRGAGGDLIDKTDRSAFSHIRNMGGYTNIVVNVGDTVHDEERGWVDVKSGLAGLDEVNVAYRSGRTTQKMQSFRRRGSDPIRLRTNVQYYQ